MTFDAGMTCIVGIVHKNKGMMYLTKTDKYVSCCDMVYHETTPNYNSNIPTTHAHKSGNEFLDHSMVSLLYKNLKLGVLLEPRTNLELRLETFWSESL